MDVYLFKVTDYVTILVGQKDSDGSFYIQRGDGEKQVYLDYRIEWFEKIYSVDLLSDDEIEKFNITQQNTNFHPYTCNRRSKKCERKKYPNDYTKDGQLIATKTGYVCPCGEYKQNSI